MSAFHEIMALGSNRVIHALQARKTLVPFQSFQKSLNRCALSWVSTLVAELGTRARAATAAEAAKAGDIVVVTVPLKNYRQVPVEPLAGKIVIDTNNYYPQRDGHIAELDNESTTTSELLHAHLPTSRVVKAFNHIYAAELTTHGQPAGTENRRALVIAGDDADAKAVVTRLLDQFGFDTVDAGTGTRLVELVLQRSLPHVALHGIALPTPRVMRQP
jgi:predicted dinucleotide-binding enzyme